MASILSWIGNNAKKVEHGAQRVVNQVNPLDNGRTYKQATPTNNRSVIGQLTHNGVTNVTGGMAKGLVQLPLQASENFNNTFANIGNQLPGSRNRAGGRQTIQQNMGGTPISNKLLKFSGATGTNKQLAGDAAQIALSTVPGLGKGAPLIKKAAVGAVTGAGFGGASTAGNGGTKKDIVKSAAIGAALGGAIPLAAPAVKGAVKVATPKYAGLPAKQVIMDTRKLDTLHNYLAQPESVALKQDTINGLHQIKKDHGLDFISGTPNERAQRVAQFLEQNGEAIPQLQASQAKTAARRNAAVDIQAKYAPGMRTNAVNDAGESLGMNGTPLKTGGSSTKLVPPRTDAVAPGTSRVSTKLVAEPGVSSLPEYGTKKVSSLDKAFRSTRSNIERQGEHGKSLAGLLQGSRDTEELMQADIQKRLPTVRDLSGREFENFVDATQGKAKASSPRIQQAIDEWQAVHPGIRERAVGAGLDVGDLGPNYYPHFIDYDKIFKDKNIYNASINHLVESGQAPNQAEAIKLLNYAKDVSRNRKFGNLEASREIDLPFYDKTPNSLVSYISGSTRRIAQTEMLGAKDEKALALITKAGQQGFDTQAMKEAYDVASGAKRYNESSTKISNALRGFQSTTRLGLGALTNSSQNVNTGIVTGHLRTLGAMAKQLSPKTREFVADTGTISDAVLNDIKTQAGFVGKTLNHITAPGFGAVEKFNRAVASTAGRDYALRLAQKGDEATLRKLGVTGEIKNKTLSKDQQIQAARKVVEKTQFKVDPQDLPGWTDSPGGKLVSQFRTFSYNQAKFFSNEIVKPAAKGDVLPLGRLLAALPLGYGLYEAKRVINGRPEEESKTKRGLATFQNVGGAGVVFDLYQSLNPPGSKYIPTDRRTSMAVSALGGPTAGLAAQGVGAASEALQRKNIPEDSSKLDGKVAALKSGDKYTDLTPAARLALNQIPIVGGPIKNRVLPYKKEAEASGGASTNSPGGVGKAVDELKAKEKKQSADLKNSLSADDYKLSKLSKTDRQKLLDSGKVTQKKLDGLDGYVTGQKKKLGIDKATPTKEAYYKAPDAEYKALQTAYSKKKFNSPAQKITATKELGKAKVGAAFDKSIRDAYNLSNADLYSYVSQDKDGKAIVDKVLAYSQALKDAGYTSTAKFKNKYGQVTLSAPKAPGGSSGRRGSKIKSIKVSRINTAAKGFKVKKPKSPSFKAKRQSVPKLASIKTPKVNKKVVA